MSTGVFTLVLFAAFLHAGWNAVIKGSHDTLLSTALVMGSAGLIALPLLPWLPLPAAASWPWLATSVLLQLGYYLLVARTYRVTDMGQSYPLMRGIAPIMVALLGAFGFGEPLHPLAWLGIGLVSSGILTMATGLPRKHLALPLFTACVIAGYTIVDARGARASGHAWSYALWLALLSGLPLLLWLAATRRAAFAAFLHGNLAKAAIGGVGTLGSYGIALWAMTRAPMAMVAALRELAIVFGLLFSVLLLGERVSTGRVLAAGLIVCGAITLRLA